MSIDLFTDTVSPVSSPPSSPPLPLILFSPPFTVLSSLHCPLLPSLYYYLVQQPKFDVTTMHQQGKREAQRLVDDGSGKVEIWRIEDFERVPQEQGLYGQFFGGDSYVILYTYLVNSKENYIIYFWQGQVGATVRRTKAANMSFS